MDNEIECNIYLLGDTGMRESEWYLQLCQLLHTGKKDICVQGRLRVRI